MSKVKGIDWGCNYPNSSHICGQMMLDGAISHRCEVYIKTIADLEQGDLVVPYTPWWEALSGEW